MLSLESGLRCRLSAFRLVRLPCALRRAACQSFSFQLNFPHKSHSRIAVGRRERRGCARPHIGRFLPDQDRLAGFRRSRHLEGEKHFWPFHRPYRPEQLIDAPVSRSLVQRRIFRIRELRAQTLGTILIRYFASFGGICFSRFAAMYYRSTI